jgi:hypothetical protein
MLGVIVRELDDERGYQVVGFAGGRPKVCDIQKGDIVLAIDGTDTAEMSADAISSKMATTRDPVELKVGRRFKGFRTVTVTRPDGNGPIGLQLEGLGVGRCESVAVLNAGSCAEVAGIKVSDFVVEVDGANAEHMSHEDLVAWFKATKGSFELSLATGYNGVVGAESDALPEHVPNFVPPTPPIPWTAAERQASRTPASPLAVPFSPTPPRPTGSTSTTASTKSPASAAALPTSAQTTAADLINTITGLLIKATSQSSLEVFAGLTTVQVKRGVNEKVLGMGLKGGGPVLVFLN